MSDEPDPDRLAALARKLAEARRARAPAPRAEEHFSQASQGWRMVIELVSGLGIGFGIGYGLDRAFGTMPLFLVLFILLGFAAGVKVMLRTAREIAEREAGGADRTADGTAGRPGADDEKGTGHGKRN
ncbi:MAG: F0F1 ATP synthase subunit I [Alphaproteobacteria bacterium HGW-Alphaproteobacteria-6]|nr:MAG: F0F1 ATP synthase subunit I [Alphaproteobacteria bacterium HGW-Alphaproteobacteria-6]